MSTVEATSRDCVEHESTIQLSLGKRIRDLRRKKNLSQENLAYEIGIDRTYIASVENGKRNVSIKIMEKFWKYFKLTPSEFFDDPVFHLGADDAED